MNVNTTVPVPEVTTIEPTGCSKFWECLKDTGQWIGHKFTVLWKEYIYPALVVLAAFLQTGYGIACLGVIVGAILLSISQSTCAPTPVRVLLNILAIGCLFGAGVAFTKGPEVLIFKP